MTRHPDDEDADLYVVHDPATGIYRITIQLYSDQVMSRKWERIVRAKFRIGLDHMVKELRQVAR